MSSIFQKLPFNYQYYVGQGNLVNYRFDTVNQTMPQTNAVLHSNIVIPGKTFVQDGQLLTIYCAGNLGAHGATAPSMLAQLNGTTICSVNIAGDASARGWELWLRIWRINGTNNQAVMFGNWITAIVSPGAGAGSISFFGARNFLNPFGGAGFGFDVDNTFQMLCTDAGGAEVITQEITYVTIQ